MMSVWTDPEHGHRVELFADADVSAADVVALWTDEAGLSADEAARRVPQLTHVATDASGALIAVSTTFLARYPPLDLDLWHFRAFVSAEHRRSHLAMVFLTEAYAHLGARRGRGEITGEGVLVVAEDEALKRGQPQAMWPRTRFAYVGDNAHGWPIRVRYFEHASAPEHGPAATVEPVPPAAAAHRVETVRGALDDGRRDQILDLWGRHGVLEGEAAQQRLPQVVAVLVDDDGRVIGVNSVVPESVRHLGDRRLWMYRRFVEPRATDDDQLAMLAAAYDALASEYAADPSGPIGVCALFGERPFLARHREASWSNGFLYAGYLPDERQIRTRYFEGASIFR